MIPYLIGHLGVAAYGLVPLATTVTSYMGLLTIALNSAVGRFMTIALDRQDITTANLVFNTSFWGTMGVLIILLAPALWLSLNAQFFFNAPPGYEDQFFYLFILTVGVFYLTSLRAPFGITAFCHNRFDLSNAVRITETVVRVIAILLLFNLCFPKVWHVGLAMLLSSVIGLILAIIICHYLTPMLKLQLSGFNRKTLKELTGTGGWILINQIGSLLYVSIDLVVVNKMIGAEAGGEYGAVMMWSTMLRSLAGVVAGVFAPTIISLYGRHDTPGLVVYCRRAIKFLGVTMALPIGLICGLAQPLLYVWLGPAFDQLAPLMMLMTIHLCVNLAVLPIFNIQVATNHVRLPGVLTCIMGAGNLGLALLLTGPVGWGMYGVAAAGAVMLTAKNLIFTPLYGAYILGLGYQTFFVEIFPVVFTTLGLASIGWMLTQGLHLNNWFDLGLTAIGLTVIFVVLTYRFLLTNEERLYALRLIGPRGAIARS